MTGIALAGILFGGCGYDRVASPPTPQFTSGQRAEPVVLANARVAGGDAQVGFDLQSVEPDVAGVLGVGGQAGAVDAQVGTKMVSNGDAAWTGDASGDDAGADDAGTDVVTAEVVSSDVVSAADPVAVDDTGQAAPNETGWLRFDDALGRRLVPANLAASVAVMVDGNLVHTAAFGVRLPGSNDIVTSTDRFRIASISKTVTAIVVMQLVDEGVLTLDDPIGQTLAEYLGVAAPDVDAARLTVRQLLSHRSGFGPAEGMFFGNGASSCADAAVRGLSTMVGSGTSYDYSNMNFCVLGMLIEAVTGKTYERVVQESLLDPLGISGMRLTSTYEIGPDEVSHFPSPGRNFMEVLGAAGSWNATPSDIVRIVNSVDPATDGWKSLTPASMSAMRGLGVGYGLGVINYDAQAWGHTGTIQNAHSMVLVQANGITWAITVAGDHPSETSQLRNIFQASLATAFPS